MLVNFNFVYRDGSGHEEDLQKEVNYIPDSIFYRGCWWDKTSSTYDFDSEKYTKIYYQQHKEHF